MLRRLVCGVVLASTTALLVTQLPGLAVAAPTSSAPPPTTTATQPPKSRPSEPPSKGTHPLHATAKFAATTGRAAPNAVVQPTAVAAPGVPFAECPAIGLDTSCGVLVQVTDGATNIYNDPSQGPYDGSDDTLIGVVNNSSKPVSSLQLSSNTNLFGFDGDGLCTASPAPAGCPFGPTGYEGPGTTFSGVTPDASGGTVSFTTPLAPGATAYFSLEEALTATAVYSGGPSLSEQGGGPNPSEKITTCYAKQPVNCATGAFIHDFTDQQIPGRGPALDFARTYSSTTASTDSPLGFGWNDTYAMALSADSAGNVTIAQENGSTLSFTPNGSGGYNAPPRILASLTKNGDGTYSFTRRANHIRYDFSATGQLTAETDLNGNTTTLAYIGGQLSTVTDSSGRQFTFAYNGNHITKVTGPLGRTTSFAYDSAGNLSQTTDPAGRVWRFTYDSNHLLLTMTDPRGGVLTNTYDSSARVTKQVDAAGLATTWSYTGDPTSPSGGTTTMTDEHGVVTTTNYSNLELTSVVHGAGTSAAATTSYTYDPATLGRTQITDPDGHVTTNTYDHNGNLLTTADALGDKTSYTYNSLDEVTAKTTPAGETTTNAYDGSGNPTSTTDPLGKTSTFGHTDATHPGDLTSVTDPDGRLQTFAYDAAGNQVSATTAPSPGNNRTSTAGYDAASERVCATSPNATAAGTTCPGSGATPAGAQSWTYDAVGEVTASTDAAGRTTKATYDADGNTTGTIDPAGNTTQATFDADNRQTSAITGAGRSSPSVTKSGYDIAPGCPAASTGTVYCTTTSDPRGNTTVDAYSVRGQMLAETRPGSQTTSHAYDLAGNQTLLTDPLGQATSYTYDNANRLTATAYSDGTTPNVSYSYDADGRRTAMTDGTGTTSYTFDAAGHLTSQKDGSGSTVGYAYDGAGNATSLTYPNGKTVTRAFDAAGQLTGVTDWLGHTTTFGYDNNGNPTNTVLPNGDTETAAFDAVDQLTGAQVGTTGKTGSPLLALTDVRNTNEQVSKETSTGAQSSSTNYGYDNKNRLTSAGSANYGYDLGGNPTAFAGVTQNFDSADQLTTTTAAGTTTFGFNKNGDRITANPGSGPKLTYGYDQANRLTTATSTTSPAPTVTAVSPTNGPAAGGTTVTISGTGFTGATAVAFGSTKAKFTVGSDSAITATSPAGTGSVDITVTTPNGTSAATAADQFTYTTGTGPIVTRVSPHTGRAQGGDLVVILGAHLTGVKSVHFGPKTAKFYQTPWLPGIVFAISPAGSGTVDVTITTAAGTSKTVKADQFTYRGTTTKPDTAATPTVAGPSTTTTLGTYAYNGDGLRTSKQTGTGTEAFTWNTAGTQPQLLADGTTSFLYGPDGLPIEQIDGAGTPSYFFHDQLGSTRALLNQAGAVAATFTYDAYGRTTASTGSTSTPLLFAAGYRDAETGLYYGYAANDPVDHNDPTGAILPILLGAGIGAITGAVGGAVGYGLDTLVFHNEPFDPRHFAGAVVGGLVGGAVTGACTVVTASPVVCGAFGGQIGEFVNEGVGGEPYDPAAIISSTVFGGLGGLIPDPFPLIGARPYKISNLIFPSGANTVRWYGNWLLGGITTVVAQEIFKPAPVC